jgi:chemotaxis protein MotB
MSRRRRRHKPEEHGNHEAWAIPYGDLVTLLLAFFVVMYAISSVNAGKYRVLSDSLVAAFHGDSKAVQSDQVGEAPAGAHRESDRERDSDGGMTIVQQAMLEGEPRALLQASPETADPAAAALRRMAEEVELALSQLVDANLIAVRRTAYGVEVEIRADILFPSGSSDLSAAALPVLSQVATTLKKLPNPVRVEGHTDNVPLRGRRQFPSNWELSAARAASVVHLFTEQGMAPGKLSVAAFGEQRPVQTNATTEGRNANRRVLIVVLGDETTVPAVAQPPVAPAAPVGTETAVVPAAPQTRDGNPSPAAM